MGEDGIFCDRDGSLIWLTSYDTLLHILSNMRKLRRERGADFPKEDSGKLFVNALLDLYERFFKPPQCWYTGAVF